MRPWWSQRERERTTLSEFVLNFACQSTCMGGKRNDRAGPSSSSLIARNLFNLYIFSGEIHAMLLVGRCEWTAEYIAMCVQLSIYTEWRPKAGVCVCVCVSIILSLPLACTSCFRAGRIIISHYQSGWSGRDVALRPSYSIKHNHSTVLIYFSPKTTLVWIKQSNI